MNHRECFDYFTQVRTYNIFQVFFSVVRLKKNRHDHGDLSWPWCVCVHNKLHMWSVWIG